MPSDHAMIDIETLGTRPGCGILAVGAVRFDPYDLDETIPPPEMAFMQAIKTSSLRNFDFEIDPETCSWWVRESASSPATVGAVFDPENAVDIEVALSRFSEWLKDVQFVWSHGATFDLPILAEAYRRLDRKVPWNFRNARDTRTVLSMTKIDPAERRHKHHPVMDAWAQVVDMKRCYRMLGLSRAA